MHVAQVIRVLFEDSCLDFKKIFEMPEIGYEGFITAFSRMEKAAT